MLHHDFSRNTVSWSPLCKWIYEILLHVPAGTEPYNGYLNAEYLENPKNITLAMFMPRTFKHTQKLSLAVFMPDTYKLSQRPTLANFRQNISKYLLSFTLVINMLNGNKNS